MLRIKILKQKVLSCMAAEISRLWVTFFIKFNLVRWWNTSINVALFHPRQLSFYKATQFPFILKLIIKYGWNKICASNFQLVKYSSKFQPSFLTLTYKGIIYWTFHFICLPLLFLLIGITLNYSPKIVNWEIFIPNLNWIKNISCYDN